MRSVEELDSMRKPKCRQFGVQFIELDVVEVADAGCAEEEERRVAPGPAIGWEPGSGTDDPRDRSRRRERQIAGSPHRAGEAGQVDAGIVDREAEGGVAPQG